MAAYTWSALRAAINAIASDTDTVGDISLKNSEPAKISRFVQNDGTAVVRIEN